MQKIFNKILSFGLAVALCLGITAVVHSTSPFASVAATDYYTSITATGGNALLGQVHDLITSSHTKYASYAECRDLGPTTDPALSGTGVVEFYTHETITTFSGTRGTWNREHVWAQANTGGLWGTSGAGSDLHHIRPAEAQLNNDRGNKKYGEVTNGSEAWSKTTSGANSKLGGHMSGNTFEPLDNVKGDVARIVMYLYTHYNTYSNVYGTTNGNGSSSYFGTLKFTQIISASTESEAISLLLEWNESDPVDQIERTRNEEAFKVQGNRNAFIDHPEYADAIWGDGSDADSDVGGEAGAFHTAVAGIVTDGTLSERLASLNQAITAYQALSEAEKTSAAEDVEILLAAILDYDKTVKAYNQEAEEANKGALGGAGRFLY